VRWSRALSFQRSALDALDDASSGLTVSLGGAPANLIVAFVDGAFRRHAAFLGRELERRHRGAVTLVVPVASLGLPVPDAELPHLVLHAASAPSARFVPWRCDPATNRLNFPMLPGPLGLLLFADASSLDIDRLTSALAARVDLLAGLALHDVPSPWPLAIGGDLVEGGAIGVFCDEPSFAEAHAEPMAIPVGPAMIVTGGPAGVVQSLDGRPALVVLEEWARALPDPDRLAMGLDVALDLRVQGVRSGEGDLAICRMVALDREQGAFLVEVPTRPYQALRFATRNDEAAVAAIARAASDGNDGAGTPVLLWPLEATPMTHWPEALRSRRDALSPWALRGATPLVGAERTSQPAHRHALGMLRFR
jgi:hypothetical protein